MQIAEFNSDGTRIATASTDGTARVWIEPLKPADGLALREQMRAVLRASAGQNTPYLRMLRRFVLE